MRVTSPITLFVTCADYMGTLVGGSHRCEGVVSQLLSHRPGLSFPWNLRQLLALSSRYGVPMKQWLSLRLHGTGPGSPRWKVLRARVGRQTVWNEGTEAALVFRRLDIN